MIDYDTLVAQAGAALVTQAENAVDVESVSAYRFDKRGRLEGGIKPAPPSREPSAYVRITKRGRNYLVDCRRHGKPGWCIHAAILALHHLGKKPVFRVKAQPVDDAPAQLGLRLVLDLNQTGARFRIKSLSSGSYIPAPLTYLSQNPSLFNLTQRAVELFNDLSETDRDHFHINRIDLAAVLAALRDTPLSDGTNDLTLKKTDRPPPTVEVAVRKNAIHWRLQNAPEDPNPAYLPGWPGFVLSQHTLLRYTGYVPDLQHLVGKTSPLPLTAENLAAFATQKHGVHWQTPKPTVLRDLEQPGLQLQPDGRDLAGRLGFWYRDRFLPLENLTQTVQLPAPDVLLLANTWRLTSLGAEVRKIRAPWRDDVSFQVREQQAAGFLQNLPDTMRHDRAEADRWFGMSEQSITCNWQNGAPSYTIDGAAYSHDELIGGVMEGGRGVQRADGSKLNVNITELIRNQEVLNGVNAIHDDEAARAHLLARINGTAPEEEPPQLPKSWRDILRPYQQEGVQWLLANHGRGEPSLLADDMGLGKTVQTLAFLDLVRADLPQLVVAPTSLLMNWEREAEKFSPKRRVIRHHGPKRATDAEALQAADLVLISYGTLRRDIEMLYDVQFQVVVLDEAQAVKNAATQTARAVSELWCDHRMALSGTPIENRITELWAIFHFLAPGYLGEEEEVKLVTMPGTPRFEGLKAKVGPFIKRRLKTVVEKDLPEKQEIVIKLPLEPGQRALYEGFQRDSRRELTEGKKNTVSILTKLMRLRQIACHPGLADESYLAAESNKFDFLLDQVAEVIEAGHAALIFSQFTKLLGLLKFALEERDLSYLYLDGATRNRQDLVDRFQAGEAPLFLISLKAGGTGLNLTRASYVYHLDPWWNPMAEAQATDRAHRIGQTRRVISYKIISEGTVEERILKLQASKKFLADGLWEDAETLMAKLDQETLLSLI